MSLEDIANLATARFIMGKAYTHLRIKGELPPDWPAVKKIEKGVYSFATREILEWLHEHGVVGWTWQELRLQMYAFNKQAQRLLSKRLGLDDE